MRVLRLVMGYCNSTPPNVILVETKKPPLYTQARYLCHNFLTHTFMVANHPLLSILRDLILYLDTYPSRDKIGSFLLPRSFCLPPHALSVDLPTLYSYEALLFSPEVDTTRERLLLQSRMYAQTLGLCSGMNFRALCLYTDGFKISGAPFVRFALVSLGDAYLRRYKILGLVFSYRAKAMAIIEALNLGATLADLDYFY